ncbi:MAG: CRISPR-associated endonuclease Cas3'' [Xanthomonadaceae bacterium]|nr:CRISPR-associated endonuclease Cas3'' [Xanthomonadaceae bacterium]MDP2184451.1 CRISPR-associated endonuclease Cas3'' [Xanthomonadales bacterium]MDZ4114576.1 CRISPR-associated endonuclease Cas3'' [Xanthomonadaceae bacterium]MDZ4377977.1 CRISPR-associated endonuclease Cas3'' [Xanthomonadaceae bacterium]
MRQPPATETLTHNAQPWLPHRYWGKARPGIAGNANYHPLPYHSLDVAAVGYAYLKVHPQLLSFFAQHLGMSSTATRDWLCFWLALHDLGKFASAFQGLREDLVRSLQQRDATRAYTLRHDSLGALVWKDRLLAQCDVLGLGASAGKRLKQLMPWVLAVTGHHGEPPRLDIGTVDLNFDATDIKAAAQFVAAARRLLLPQDALDAALALDKGLERAGKHLSWWLAGLTVLSDWIGSNTEFFRYREEEIPLERYWPDALDAAGHALRASGVLPQPRGVAHTLPQLFGWAATGATRTPTPLQSWATKVPLLDTPQLYLLEDVTGARHTHSGRQKDRRRHDAVPCCRRVRHVHRPENAAAWQRSRRRVGDPHRPGI